jgi:Ran GTPase-activating protein (RanGAP) involved in mRNA processing and transport
LSNSQLDDDLLRLLVTSMSKGIDKRQDGLRNTLVHLDISHNKISTDGLHIILNYFFENKEFRTDTSSGSIHGSKKKGNDVLSILNLANNLIEAEGGRTLGRILRSDTSLASLNINLNRLGDEGCQMLLDGLRTNTTLKDLYIASNSLSNGAIQSLCSILSRDFCKGKSQYKKKCVLETVDLSCNAIKEDDTVRLATATSATTNLTALDLRYQSKIESSEMYVKTLDQIKRNLHRNEDHNQ